jgi:cytochrome P450
MVDTEIADRIEEIGDDFYTDPYRYYRRWRGYGAVHHVRLASGFANGIDRWLIIGYEEGRAALADPRLRKGASGINEVIGHKNPAALVNLDAQALATHMLNCDPPEHTRLRKLVNKAFPPRRVAALRSHIEEITVALLDEMAEHDEVDLLQAFAIQLPATVICELLGVPFSDRAAFQTWIKVVFSLAGGVEERNIVAVEMTQYIQGLLEAKRQQPGEDLLSGLLQISDDDDRLTEQELVSMAFLLLVAGYETTSNLIGNGTYALLRNKPQFHALRDDLTGVPAAIEEFLRYDGPVGWSTVRYTDEPVHIGEIEIPAGEFVHIAVAAANRDPARYPDPDRLDIARNPSGHLAFGHGIHFCVGASLARLEAEIAFTSLVRRFPGLELAYQPFTPKWRHSTLLRSLVELPVRLR